MSKWTTSLAVNFVPLPKEKEAAYWAAITYFAEIMFADLLLLQIDPPPLVETAGGHEATQKPNPIVA